MNYENNYQLEYVDYPILFQLILSFVVGLILAPFSQGLLLWLVYVFVFEAIYIYQTNLHYCTQSTAVRLGVLCAGLFGFILGRTLVGDPQPLRGSYKYDKINDDSEIDDYT